jgi:hypothetical protein
MHNNGIPVIILSRRLGYSRPSVTQEIYEHLDPSMQSDIAGKIEELISPIPLKQTSPKLNQNIRRTEILPFVYPHRRGEHKEKPPTGGGKAVGGTGLEPALSSL